MAESSNEDSCVESLQDYINIILNADEYSDFRWFRGQPETELSLIPKIYRKDYDERFLTQTFRLRAKSRYGECPPLNDYPSWLFLMQHYGLPTRLLDWSASPLVAAFFAVEDRRINPTENEIEMMPKAEVIALNPDILNYFERRYVGQKRQLRFKFNSIKILNFQKHTSYDDWIDPWESETMHHFSEPFRGSYSRNRPFWPENPDDAILAIKPIELDARVASQKSRFTIHGRTDPLENHPLAPEILRQIRICGGKKRYRFQEDLRSLGISRMTIFPDLDNLSEDLARFGKEIDR